MSTRSHCLTDNGRCLVDGDPACIATHGSPTLQCEGSRRSPLSSCPKIKSDIDESRCRLDLLRAVIGALQQFVLV
jgi:hypothetical protein